jgi:hypothetical protein
VGLHRFNSELQYRGNLMTHRGQYNPYLHISVLYTVMLRSLYEDYHEEPLLALQEQSLHAGNFCQRCVREASEVSGQLNHVLLRIYWAASRRLRTTRSGFTE